MSWVPSIQERIDIAAQIDHQAGLSVKIGGANPEIALIDEAIAASI